MHANGGVKYNNIISLHHKLQRENIKSFQPLKHAKSKAK